MDPFSITLGVVTLTTVASKIGLELKKLRNGAQQASTNINAMLADLKALKAVLELIEDGFEELDGSAPLTGHIGAHWLALKTTLNEGCNSMNSLQRLLVHVNTDVRYLGSIRRVARLKEANDQIVMYRQEIQAYKDALQLSLQSVVFFQQITIKEDTSKILSSSNDLHQDLNRLAANIDVKLTALEIILTERHKSSPTGAASVTHLQNTVRTAATVVTSASTVFADETNDESLEPWDLNPDVKSVQMDYANSSDLTLDWVASQSTARSVSRKPLSRSNGDGEHQSNLRVSPPWSLPASPVVANMDGLRSKEADMSVPPQSPSLQVTDTSNELEKVAAQDAPMEQTPRKKRFSLSRLLLTTVSPQPRDREKTQPTPLCMNYLHITPTGKVFIKLTFVGDGAAGKTCFLIATSKGVFPEIYVPTVFENYLGEFVVDKIPFECALWDTAGQDDYDRLRPFSYPDTQVYCICFAIDGPDSLDNVKAKWIGEVLHFKRPQDPIFLLGFKKDLRYDPRSIQYLQTCNQKPVTEQEGEQVAKEIGAVKYLECSAKTREGANEVFPTILGMILEASPGLKDRYKSGEWRYNKGKRRLFGYF